MHRHIGIGDSKNVIVFDPILTGHVIWRMRSHAGPYTILADNSIYLDCRAMGIAYCIDKSGSGISNIWEKFAPDAQVA